MIEDGKTFYWGTSDWPADRIVKAIEMCERYNLHKPITEQPMYHILGRDKEVELAFLTLMRHEKPNVLLTGEAGVGKTSIVHQLAYLIANDLCPDPLKGFQLIEINTNSLLAGPGYRGVTEQKFDDIIQQSLSNGKTILFFDEFHTVESLGQMANGQTPGLGNTLKPYLTRPDFRVIGATTISESKTINDKALLRRFFNITVNEPTDEAVLTIIESCIHHYGKGLKFKKEIIPQILDLSKTMDGYNPDKAKDITDFVCSYAKMKSLKSVNTNQVSEFFDTYFLLKKEQSEPDAIID